MMAATNTSAMYSWKNMMIISLIVAPITFLIAISFCLWVMIEDEIEYIPNKEMRIQRKLKIENNLNIAIPGFYCLRFAVQYCIHCIPTDVFALIH